MKLAILISGLLLLVFSMVNAAPNPAPVPPEVDPFYKPPQGYEDLAHGTVLRYRKTPHKLRSLYLPINPKESWQLLVRSTDTFGNASYIVTTVIVPYNADPTKLVSFQFAEDSPNYNCSISYTIQYGAPFIPSLTYGFEMTFVSTLLDKGYYVVIPDYEGPHSAFGASRNAGQATLDSLLGVYGSTNTTGLSPDAKAVMWGYSGGTVASTWAAVLLDDYAPQLKPHLLGAALGGWVANITSVIDAGEGSLVVGLTPNILNGLQQEYPELNKYLLEEINPAKLENYNVAKTKCLADPVFYYPKEKFFTGNDPYFPKGWSVLQNPIASKILSAQTLAVENNDDYPRIPLFIYHGLLDKIVPHKETERAYDNWCKWGKAKSIELSSGIASGHLTEYIEGGPAALVWIEARFAGKPTVQGCKETTRITNLFYPGVKKSATELAQGIKDALFNQPLGPNGESLNLTHLELF